MITKHLRNLVTVLAGVWLLISPWILDYSDSSYAKWSAVIVGLAVIASEAVAFKRPGIWEEMVDLALGTYLIASPLILGFESSTKIADNAAMVGLLVMGLGVIGLMDDPKAQRWWNDHIHHPS